MLVICFVEAICKAVSYVEDICNFVTVEHACYLSYFILKIYVNFEAIFNLLS